MISDDDKKRITAAIREAERKTSGEIFCVVAQQAGNYRTIPFALAAGFSLIVPLPFILWSNWPASAIYTAQLAAFIALVIIFSLPTIRFRIVPQKRKHERAHAEAMSQFFAHGLQNTAQRTGVLIFAAAAERPMDARHGHRLLLRPDDLHDLVLERSENRAGAALRQAKESHLLWSLAAPPGRRKPPPDAHPGRFRPSR